MPLTATQPAPTYVAQPPPSLALPALPVPLTASVEEQASEETWTSGLELQPAPLADPPKPTSNPTATTPATSTLLITTPV